MKHVVLNLILSAKAAKIIDSFASLMKLRIVFYSLDGKVIKQSRNEGNSPYCRLMQDEIFGIERCLKLDETKHRECRESQKIITYKCHAGLTEVVAPLVIYGDVVGYIICGQFRMSDAIPCFIKDEKLKQLYLNQQKLDYEALDNILEMMKMLMEYITEKELIATEIDYRMMKIKNYIDTHYQEEISLNTLARYMCCSESTLSHYLQNHDTTLKYLIRDRRISAAEELMKNNADLTFSEIATMVGYNDSHYFSRIYHKHRGITLSEKKSRFYNKKKIKKS
ncbi:MAG: PocR ligand-binding domain-containing protein [Lentisphaeria bacterium]|nr:PocR ligand-binding domain-containing protein [Lentisphaeria bacterium]